MHSPMESTPTKSKNNNNIQGVGITMEGINQNYVVYDLMTEMSWRSDTRMDSTLTSHDNDDSFLSAWMKDYVVRRYGLSRSSVPFYAQVAAQNAWAQLLQTVYTCPKPQWGVTKSKAVRRPRMANMTHDGFQPTAPFYRPERLHVAWMWLLVAGNATALGSLETFRYDLVDVTRQCLSDFLITGQTDIVQAFEDGDESAFEAAAARFLEILDDMETLLATHELFLFETQWMTPARQRAGNDPELLELYEFNARNQMTMWGPEGEISDYASKQFAGLMSSYYRPRWALFVKHARAAMSRGEKFDDDGFHAASLKWEKQWQQRHEKYPDRPVGDTLEVSQRLYQKYIVSPLRAGLGTTS